MANEFNLTWETKPAVYAGDADVVKFDFYLFPIELLPEMIKQAQSALYIYNCSANFKAERALQAERAGVSSQKFISDALRLKHTQSELF